MEHFVHLHVHTHYSLGNGLAPVAALCSRVKELGMRSIAITDYHSLAAVPEFMYYASQFDLKPIFGVQLDVGSIIPESQYQTTINQQHQNQQRHHSYSLVLLARTAVGFRNLVRIVNQANQLAAQKKGALPIAFIAQYSDGLIILSGGHKSEITFRLRQNQVGFASEAVSQFSTLFGEKNFYLELTGENFPDRDAVNGAFIALARQYALPLVAANNVHYLNADDAFASRLLVSLRDGMSLMLPVVPDRYLKNAEEMTAIFANCPGAIENTEWIADRCETYHPHMVSQMPYFVPPTGYDTESYLWELCQRGLVQKYRKPSLSVRQRLNEEFGLLRKKGLMDYTLIVYDFTRYLREKGVQYSLDRTNLSYSLINYLLGITRLDVVKDHLNYGFFYFGSDTPYPALELEYDLREKDLAVAYFRNRYGVAHVAGTMQYTSYSIARWMTEVANQMHIPSAQLAPILSYFPAGSKFTVNEIISQEKELAKRIQQNPELITLVNTLQVVQHAYLAQEIDPKTTVIARDSLFANYPLTYRDDETMYLQYPAEHITSVKLLGVDLRSQPLSAALADTISQIKKRHAQTVDIYSLDLDDPRIYKSIKAADTVAYPYLESSSLRSLLQELVPRNFTELTTAIALHRSGYPSGKLIADYLSGYKANKAILSLHSAVKQILGSTRGMILYKEQVLELIKTIAQLPERDATETLKHLLTLPRVKKSDELRNQFIKSGTEAGFTHPMVEKIWQFLVADANLGRVVTKPEIIAAMELSLRCAQLKRIYPTEYFYGLIRQYAIPARAGRLSSYLNEAKRSGVTIKLPDINHSEVELAIEDTALRLGLTLIDGIGVKIAEHILAKRKEKRFTSLFDFCRRTDPGLVTRRTVENLIRSGACDSLVRYRSQLLSILTETLTRARHSMTTEPGSTLFDLKPYSRSIDSVTDPYPDIDEFPLVEKLAMEKQTTGIYISGSPLSPYRTFLTGIDVKPLRNIPRFMNALTDHTYYVAGTVAEHTLISKKGKAKEKSGLHLYLEDETGTIRLTLTPKQTEAYRALVESDRPLLVQVGVQKYDDRPALVVNDLADLAEMSRQLSGTMLIELLHELDRKQFKSVYAVLQQHRGTNPVAVVISRKLRNDAWYGKLTKLQVNATQWLIYELESMLNQKPRSIQMVGTLPLFEKSLT